MVNMDSMAKGSTYEGFNQLDAAKWSSEVLRSIEQNDVTQNKPCLFPCNLDGHSHAVSAVESLEESAREIEDLCKKLTLKDNDNEADSSIISNYADQLKTKLMGLKSEESYCMAGGWLGNPTGHAMVYRFKKTNDGAFDIYIYNAQGGSELAEGGVREAGGKVKSKPCYCFSNVTCEELLFANKDANSKDGGNSIILQRLIEWNCKPPTQEKGGRDANGILNFFSRFAAKLIPTSRLPSLYLSTQRSGNCTFKSINCLLLEIMNDETKDETKKEDGVIGEKHRNYKRIMLEARLLSLLAFYNKYVISKDTKTKLDYWQCSYMLEHAVEGYLRVLLKNVKNNIITSDEFEQAFGLCHELYNNLRAKEEEVRKSSKDTDEANEKVNCKIDTDDINKQNEKRRSELKSLLEAKKLSSDQDENDFSLDITLGDDLYGWGDLPKKLQILKELLDKATRSSLSYSPLSRPIFT